MCLCHRGAAHTLSGAMLQNNKIVMKYSPDTRCNKRTSAMGKHILSFSSSYSYSYSYSYSSSYLRTRSKVLFSNQPILSPKRLSFPPVSPGHSHGHGVRTRAAFSGTCQLQTITAINGLPSLGPPVAPGSWRRRGRRGKVATSGAAAVCL